MDEINQGILNPINVNKDLEETVVEGVDLEGFEVARREFFSHTFECSVSFRIDSIMFNTATLKKLPDIRYIHLLVNPDAKKVVIKSCDVDAKDSIRWCQYNETKDHRTPKKILCRIFAAKVFDMMDWNIEYRYKIQGNIIKSPEETIIVFDLNEPEVFTPTRRAEDGRLMKGKAYLPEGWRDSFGLPVAEHERALDINILDGYARMEIIEKRNTKKPKIPLPVEGESVPAEDIAPKEVEPYVFTPNPDTTPTDAEAALPFLLGGDNHEGQ